jgi:hypothetical protein
MKKWVVLIIACLFTNILSQTNVSPHFSELKGMEDQQRKSNLLPNEIVNLYPLAIGNKWIYLTVSVVNPNIIYGVALNEVIGDSIAANGKLYYHLKDKDYHSLERVDTVDGKVYRFYEHPNLTESEYVIIDLFSEVGDTLITFNPGYPGLTSYLITTSIDSFYKWGSTRLRKNFTQNTFPVISHFVYGEDLGMDHYTSVLIGYSVYFERSLKGCVINGIVYGDTTLTGIDDEEKPIATEFRLEQNYPNPFNPSTIINFQLPVSSDVTLKVYDILGNEIATLVNEEKPSGSYEVGFDGKGLPSGIYFYQLKSGSFVETKKMLMIK